MRGLRGLLARTDGASAVEFALVATPFMLMLFGTIEYGRLLWTHHAISQTAIATARCVALPQDECASSGGRDLALSRDFAQAIAQGWGITLAHSQIGLSTTAQCGGVDGFVEADVAMTFVTALPEMLVDLAGGTTVTARACFPIAAG